MKFILLINIKMPTTVGILIFIIKLKFTLRLVQQAKKKVKFIGILIFMLNWVENKKKFYNLEPRPCSTSPLFSMTSILH